MVDLYPLGTLPTDCRDGLVLLNLDKLCQARPQTCQLFTTVSSAKMIPLAVLQLIQSQNMDINITKLIMLNQFTSSKVSIQLVKL